MTFVLRKIQTTTETLFREADRSIEVPVKTGIVTAVIRNPWAGMGYVADLDPIIETIAPRLAEAIVPELISIMGGPEGIEAYGKAAVAGLDGEVEHASALIHTLRFGNLFRTMAEGESFLSFTNKRGPAGTLIGIPMAHKNDRSIRSHFLTAETCVLDGPMPDEIVVSIAAASSGRPFARIGDRHDDVAHGKVYGAGKVR
jgi:Amino acid synthesis